MSDNDLERIKLKKAEILMKQGTMPNEILKVHSVEEFSQLTKKYNDKIIMIDFWAVWCGPCMTFAPVFEKLQSEYGKDFVFVKVNVDEAGSIAGRYGITGIPTTLFLKGEKVISKIVGAYPYEPMKQILEKVKAEN
jgi:thioredoxin 1